MRPPRSRGLQVLGKQDDGTQLALEACVDAHATRYGQAYAETLARLVSGHEENELVELLIRQEEQEGASGTSN